MNGQWIRICLLRYDRESNKLKILQNLPSICVELSDNLYEKIMEEKIKGDITEFNKIVSENSNES